MGFVRFLLVVFLTASVAAPVQAASWGRLQKGKCDVESGKRIYKAKLKRSFSEDSAAKLCPRFRRTIDGESRVPDMCKKSGMTSFTGYWLVVDATCRKIDGIMND